MGHRWKVHRIEYSCKPLEVVPREPSPKPRSRRLPPQGVYEECGPALSGSDVCIARLREIAAAGFKIVLNYTAWYGSAQQVTEYADAAHALGLQLIWPLNAVQWRNGADLSNYYRFLRDDCACPHDPAAFKRFAFGLVMHHPATWGYYVGDEVNPALHESVKRFSDQVRVLDPTHPLMYVSLETGWGTGANLLPFSDVADVLGGDIYPIGRNEPANAVSKVAANVQRIANGSGRDSAVVLQAFAWAQYGMRSPRWPTRAEMREMRDQALAASRPAMLLWYSYYDVKRSNDPAGHMADLTAAAFAPLP